MTTYSENCSRSIAETPVGAIQTLTQLMHNWIKNQELKLRIQNERRQLSGLSETMLRDIGISRASAEIESQRNDIPATRQKPLSRVDC